MSLQPTVEPDIDGEDDVPQAGRHESHENCRHDNDHGHEEEEASDGGDAEWEDVSESDDVQEDVLELALKTNALLITLFLQLNVNAPTSSPPPLLNAYSFICRTYSTHIVPLLPATAVTKYKQFSNPFLAPGGGNGKPSWFEMADEPADGEPPEWDAAEFPEFQQELYDDALGRNMMLALAIQDQAGKGALVLGGTYDFGEDVLDLVRCFIDSEQGEKEMREKWAAKGVEL